METPGSQRGAPLRVTPAPQDKGVGSCSPEGLSGHWNPWVPPACPAPGRSHQKTLGKRGAGAGRGKSGRTAEKREKPRGCGWGPATICSVFLCSFPPRFSLSSASSPAARWVKPVFSAWSPFPRERRHSTATREGAGQRPRLAAATTTEVVCQGLWLLFHRRPPLTPILLNGTRPLTSLILILSYCAAVAQGSGDQQQVNWPEFSSRSLRLLGCGTQKCEVCFLSAV